MGCLPRELVGMLAVQQTRAVMDVMGWSQASMATRYQHVPIEVLNGIAKQVEGLLWDPPKPDDDRGDDGSASVPVAV